MSTTGEWERVRRRELSRGLMRGLIQPTTVFTVYIVAGCYSAPHLGALYKVEVQLGGKILNGIKVNDGTPAQLIGKPVCEFLQIGEEVHKDSIMECAPFGQRSELYIVLGNGAIPRYRTVDDPTKVARTSRAFILNVDTNNEPPSCVPFSPPIAAKPTGILMSAYGKLYYLAHPVCFPTIPVPSFECYCPIGKKWEPLCPYEYSKHLSAMSFIGYAVCLGCILVSAFSGCHTRCEYKVYVVKEDIWYSIENAPAYAFVGRAVVTYDGSIYAIPMGEHGVMAFSLKRCWNAAGEIIYSFGTTSFLTGLEVATPPHDFWNRTRYLVQLACNSFCHFETGFNTFSGFTPKGVPQREGRQYMIITTFYISDSKICTVDSTIRGVPIKNSCKLSIKCCFTPDWVDPEIRRAPYVEKEEGAWGYRLDGVDSDSRIGLKVENEVVLGSRCNCLRIDSQEEEAEEEQGKFQVERYRGGSSKGKGKSKS